MPETEYPGVIAKPGGETPAAETPAVEEITGEEAFLALRDEWNALLARSGSNILFLTHEWLACWWRHFGRPLHARGRADLFVLVARRNGKLRAAAPMIITGYRYFGIPLRLVGFLGQGISDYSDFIVGDGEDREEIFSAFADRLSARSGRWDALDLRNVYGESGNVQVFADSLSRAGWTSRLDPLSLCRFLRVSGSWDSYYHGCFNRKERKNHRADWRKLESFGEANVRFIETPDAPRSLLDLLAEIESHHPHAGPGRPGLLQAGAFREFIDEFVPLAVGRGWLNVAVMDCGGMPAAYYLSFRYNERFYLYLTSYRREFRKHSVGRLTFTRTLEQLWNSGAGEIDMLRGEEDYKENWATEGRRNMRLIVGRRSLRSRAAVRALTNVLPALERRMARTYRALLVSNEEGWTAVAGKLLRRFDPRANRPCLPPGGNE